MSMRRPANRSGDKKHFTHTAQKVHKKNIVTKPMRGGIRL